MYVAILQSATDIDLLLLDIMMPEMDGFEVLAMMNKYHWIDEVPVLSLIHIYAGHPGA